MRLNNKKLMLFAVIVAAGVITAVAQRIAVLSDIHVTPGNANDTELRRAVEEINASDFDFVVVNGDLTNEGSDEQLANVKSILDGIRHRLAVLPGNHENNWSQSATHTFTELWGADRFVAEVDSLVLVGINCGPYMKMGDGHIKQEDLHWLESTLAATTAGGGKRVLSFNHYPLLEDLDNFAEYTALLERYPVIGHINGHYHTWRSYMPGNATGTGYMPCFMTRALDMRNGTFGYAIVEIDPEWIHIYNKSVGAAAEPVFAAPARTAHKAFTAPERAELTVPEGFSVDKLWTDSASIFTRLGFDAENIYFGNSVGKACAVSKADGTLVWEIATGAPLFSRPVVLGGGRVAIPTNSEIIVADGATGRVRRRHVSPEGPYVADGTLTADGRRYLQGGYKRFECRRPSDGRVMWSFDSIDNYCQAAPAVDGDDVIFGAWDTRLRCLSLADGHLKWSWDNGKNANMLGPGNVVPVISGDKVFIVAPDRFMTAVDRATGRQLWRDNSHRYRESLGASTDGSRIYAKTMDGELVAVDATADGFRELWTVDMGLGYEHAPCIIAESGGLVYAGSRRGIVTVVDPATQTVVASLPLGVSEVNGIDIDPADGSVYVSLIEGTVFRIARH